MKERPRMFVVLFRAANHEFWFYLGAQDETPNILDFLAVRVSFRVTG